MTTKTTTFKTGTTVSARSACDSECRFSFVIERRTAKTVWVNVHGTIKARRITVRDGFETFEPFGNFSMSPVVSAETTES